MGIRGIVDLGERSGEQIEREASGLEPGWFRATVADVFEEGTNLKLRFRLADGRQHTETLWDPLGSEDDKAAKKLQDRRDAIAVRLGLVPREAKGTAFEFDWCDCIGRDYVLHLVLGKPKDGKQYVQLEWMGLFDAGDHRVPEPLRGLNPKANGLNASQMAALASGDDSAKSKKGSAAATNPPPANGDVSRAATASGLNLDDL